MRFLERDFLKVWKYESMKIFKYKKYLCIEVYYFIIWWSYLYTYRHRFEKYIRTIN